MKNFKKSLIVILAACAILVTTLVSTFAESKSDASTDMITSVPGVTTDFEGDMPSFANTGNFDKVVDRTQQYYDNNEANNRYLRFMSKDEGGVTLSANSPYIGFSFGTSESNCIADKYSYIHNDYAVFDFDICADSYIDANGKLTTEEYDAQGNRNNLAYPTTLQYALFYRVDSGPDIKVESPKYNTMIVSGNNETGYFLAYNGKGVSKIQLSDKINEWTHVTMVYEIDNSVNYFTKAGCSGEVVMGDYDADTIAAIDAGEHETYKSYSYNLSGTKLHMYKDGEYIGTDVNILKPAVDTAEFWKDSEIASRGGIEKAGLYQIRMTVKNDDKRFSFGLDNLSYNLYRNGYEGDLSSHVANNKEKPIYLCNDVAYNQNYVAPDGTVERSLLYTASEESNELVVLEKIGGYGVPIGALGAATAQQYAILGCGVENYYPTTEFYVSVPEGETFTTAGDSGYEVSKTPTTVEIDGVAHDFYFVSLAAKTYEVRWYDSQDMTNILYEVSYIKGADIVYKGKMPEDEQIGENVYRIFEGWKYVCAYTDDLEPIWADFDKTVIDDEVIATTEECYELSIAPYYNVKTVYYEITNTKGVTEMLVDTPKTLGADIKAGKSIKLRCDFNELDTTDIMSSDGTKVNIVIPQKVESVIDLNGYTLNLDFGDKAYEYAFLLGNSTTLTIKSSRPGAKIYSGSGLARGNNYGNSKLYLGTKGDVAGENANITVFAKAIFGTQGNKSNSAHTVGVYGVNYYGVADTSVINQVSMMTNIEISDSIFYLDKTGAALLRVNKSTAETARGSINATITNSTIVSTTADGELDYIVRDLGNYVGDTAKDPAVPVYQVTFDNCTLYGTVIPTDNDSTTLAPENKCKVYFKNGTRIQTSEKLPCDAVVSAFLGNTIGPVEATETVTLYTPSGKVEKTIAFNYQDQIDIGYNVNFSADGGFFFNFEITKALVSAAYAEVGGAPLVGVDAGADKAIYTIPVPVASVADVKIYLDMNRDELVELTANLPEYFKAAFEESTKDADKALIVNAVNYANEIYKVVNGGADYAEYKEFIEANASLLITATEAAPAVSVTDTSVISAVQFMITEGSVPAFAFTKVSNGVVSIKYAANTVECKERTVLGVTYYVADGMPVCDMAETFEIYVGENKIGEYNILNYIEYTNNLVAKALYGYVIAAENCK